MKISLLLSALCSVVFSLCVVTSTEAILMPRLGGAAAYDTVLDITWTTDADLSETGNWWDQVAWADSLVYLGFDDWRLASVSVAAGLPIGTTFLPVDCAQVTELACRDNELGYMYYYNLGGGSFDNLTGDQTVDGVDLMNIQSEYWSATQYPVDFRSAWSYFFDIGLEGALGSKYNDEINYGWAVHDGDVAEVPEPPIVLLLVTGLIGLIGLARIRSA